MKPAQILALGITTISAITLAACDQRPVREAVLETALTSHRERDKRFQAEPLRGSKDSLRGLNREQANRIMDACSTVADWSFLGEEQRGARDAQLFALFECKQPDGSVIGRILADAEPGDRLGKLAAWSDFLACRPDLCPDFGIGEPEPDSVVTSEIRYKARPVGASIVAPTDQP